MHTWSITSTRKTHSSEIWGPFWQPPSRLGIGRNGVIQEKQAEPREGRGFCVCGVSHFITRETRNRPWKTFEAMGGVCGNRLCGYLWCQLQYSDYRLFPGLGLCLSTGRKTVQVCVSESRRLHYTCAKNLQIKKYFHPCCPLQYFCRISPNNIGTMMNAKPEVSFVPYITENMRRGEKNVSCIQYINRMVKCKVAYAIS